MGLLSSFVREVFLLEPHVFVSKFDKRKLEEEQKVGL